MTLPSHVNHVLHAEHTHLLLRVPVHVHVQHQPGEGGPEVVRQLVILHTPEIWRRSARESEVNRQ